mgnify:CR=1 FL=1
MGRVDISQFYLVVFLSFLLFPNIARSETNLNLYLVCNENSIAPKSQRIWNERTITIQEAISYTNLLDKRIERLARSREIARINGQIDEMQKYGDEVFELKGKRVREVSKYKIQISKLNNELMYGKDRNCFQSSNR